MVPFPIPISNAGCQWVEAKSPLFCGTQPNASPTFLPLPALDQRVRLQQRKMKREATKGGAKTKPPLARLRVRQLAVEFFEKHRVAFERLVELDKRSQLAVAKCVNSVPSLLHSIQPNIPFGSLAVGPDVLVEELPKFLKSERVRQNRLPPSLPGIPGVVSQIHAKEQFEGTLNQTTEVCPSQNEVPRYGLLNGRIDPQIECVREGRLPIKPRRRDDVGGIGGCPASGIGPESLHTFALLDDYVDGRLSVSHYTYLLRGTDESKAGPAQNDQAAASSAKSVTVDRWERIPACHRLTIAVSGRAVGDLHAKDRVRGNTVTFTVEIKDADEPPNKRTVCRNQWFPCRD